MSSKRHAARLAFVASGALALAVGVWWFGGSDDRAAVDRSGAQARTLHPPDGSPHDDANASATANESPRSPTAAEDTTSAAPRTAVVSDAAWIDVGPPHGHAPFHVAWSVFDNDVAGTFSTRDETIELYLLEERTARILDRRSSTTVRNGYTTVEPPAQWRDGTAEGLASGVWVTHPTCEPRFVGLEPGERPGRALSAAVPAAPAWITVRDAAGNAVAGARVLQQALPLQDHRTQGRDLHEIGRRALIVASETDDGGRVARIPLGGPSVIDAIAAGTRARIFTDGAQRDLELILAPCWRLSGSVRGTIDAGPWAMVRVVAERGALREIVGTVPVAADGTYGPLELPVVADAGAFEAHLVHGHVVPTSRTIAPPAAGDSVVLDFDVVAGHQRWIKVVDEETEAPIHGARLTWSWSTAGGARAAVHSTAGPEGFADFSGLPSGTTSVTAGADGYATQSGIVVDVGDDTPTVFEIALARAARIAGRIDYGGDRPVGFAVHHGPRGVWPLPHRLSVRSPTDGTFTIEDLAPGEYALQAIVYGQRATPIQVVALAPGETARVVLAPLPTATIVGRVLDAESGRPVPDAAPAILLIGERDETSVGLIEGASDSDGRFTLAGVPVTGAALDVWHEDYEVLWQRLPPLDAGTTLDIGDLPIIPRFAVRVELKGAVDEPQQYAVRLAGDETLHAFDEERRAELAGGTRDGSVVLVHPDGSEDHYAGTAASASDAPVPVWAKPGSLRVEFVDAEGRPKMHAGELVMFWTDAGGHTVVRTILVAGRSSLDVAAVPVDSIGYSTRAFDEELAALGTAELEDGRPLVIRLVDEYVTVRLIEPDGTPVPRASLHVQRVEGMNVVAELSGTTDDGGRARFPPMGGTHYVTAIAEDGRRLIARRLPTLRAQDTIDLVLDADHALRVRVTGDGAPLPNAPYAITMPYGSVWLDVGAANLAGEIECAAIGPDDVLLTVTVPGRWPISRLVRPTGSVLALEAPRLGSLELRVVDANFAPLAGVDIALVHDHVRQFDRRHGDLGGDVGAWMAADLVPLASMRTDASGRVQLVGLPVGRYLARAVLGSDRWIEGTATSSTEPQAPLVLVLP